MRKRFWYWIYLSRKKKCHGCCLFCTFYEVCSLDKQNILIKEKIQVKKLKNVFKQLDL